MYNTNTFRVICGIALLVCMPAASFAAEPHQLFTTNSIGLLPATSLSDAQTIKRERLTSLDVNALLDPVPGGQLSFEINLFDDVIFHANVKRSVIRPGSFGYLGVVYDPESLAAVGEIDMVVSRGVAGSINLFDGRGFSFLGNSSSSIRVKETDFSAFKDEEQGSDELIDEQAAYGPALPALRTVTGIEEDGGEDGSRAAGGETDNGGVAGDEPAGTPTATVLIVYTPLALEQVGGVDALQALVDEGFLQLNSSFANSNVDLQAKQVGPLTLVDYQESGSLSTDVSRLRLTSEGYMDEVHPVRDQYGADLVNLVIGSMGDACGAGYRPSTQLTPDYVSSYWASYMAGSAQKYYCHAGNNKTFAHEIGHNIGLGHNRGDGAAGSFFYSYGYRVYQEGSPLLIFRTVMSYGAGNTRILNFSNPDVNYEGYPTGMPIDDIENAAHNALTLNLNVDGIIVARFHPADIDESHCVDVNDLLAVIAAWGVVGEDIVADVNSDGVVNVEDLLTVLIGWGC